MKNPFKKRNILPARVWNKVDADGRVVDNKTTRRPSGPILSNTEWHKGFLWVKAED